jgi:lysophospholipase L1-like esterase
VDYTRRDFLQSITTATISATGATFLPSAVLNESWETKTDEFAVIPDQGTVLFQGDSITDGGRNKEESGPNKGLGYGYAFMATAYLRNALAARNVNCYNRGISGNKVFQLADRWDKDCLQLKPDLLSILIGVNDFWHTLSSGYDGTVEIYEKDFTDLLNRTKEQLPDVQLVIGEPFAVREGAAINDDWFPAFTEYQAVAKKLAREFDAAFIPYQSVFDEAGKKASPTYWTGDGVHPTLAGSHLMAEAWLETVKRM